MNREQAIQRRIRRRRLVWNRVSARWRKAPRPDRWSLTDLDQALKDYRFLLGEIAWLAYHAPQSEALPPLEQAARNLHWALYHGEPPASSASLKSIFLYEAPAVFQRHLNTFKVVCAVFLAGFLFTFTAASLDDWMAYRVLPPHIVQLLQQGKTWLDDPAAFPSPSLMSTSIILNNTMVAVYLYATGVTFGAGTFYIFWRNIMMLGALLALGVKYGAFGTLFRFILAHGVLEISGLLVETTAGFILALGILAPGLDTRRQSLKRRGRESLVLFIGTLPWIVLAGLIEGFISPRYATYPMSFRAGIGTAAALLLWLYLFRPQAMKRRDIPPAGTDFARRWSP